MSYDTKPHPTRDGWFYDIHKMTFGKYRILLTDGLFIDSNW